MQNNSERQRKLAALYDKILFLYNRLKMSIPFTNGFHINIEKKESTIKGAGKGIFTKDFIPKGWSGKVEAHGQVTRIFSLNKISQHIGKSHNC